MSQPIQFIYLTQAKYDELTVKQQNRIYFTSDTHRIYRGGTLFSLPDIDLSNLECDSVSASTMVINGEEVATQSYVDEVIGDIESILSAING